MRDNTDTSTAHSADAPNEKWYQQFWPWFLIAILGSGIIGCIVTIVIAENNAPIPTRDDIGRFGQVIDSKGTEQQPPSSQ